MDSQTAQDMAQDILQRNEDLTHQLDQQKSSLIQWIADPTPTLDDIKHKLKGEEFNQEKNTYHQEYSPITNKKGVSKIMSHLNLLFVKSNPMSNFDVKDINDTTFDLAMEFSQLIGMSYGEWDIDKKEIPILATGIERASYGLLLQAKGAGMRNLIKETEKHTETYVQHEQPTKGKSWVGRIFG